MKTIEINVNEVNVIKSVIASTIKTAKSDLRGSDVVTKKLFDETIVALEAISNHLGEKFNVTEFEGKILATVIETTISSLKSDARGANQITKRMLSEQIVALENVHNQLVPKAVASERTEATTETKVDEQPATAATAPKPAAKKTRKSKTNKVPEIETLA